MTICNWNQCREKDAIVESSKDHEAFLIQGLNILMCSLANLGRIALVRPVASEAEPTFQVPHDISM